MWSCTRVVFIPLLPQELCLLDDGEWEVLKNAMNGAVMKAIREGAYIKMHELYGKRWATPPNETKNALNTGFLCTKGPNVGDVIVWCRIKKKMVERTIQGCLVDGEEHAQRPGSKDCEIDEGEL